MKYFFGNIRCHFLFLALIILMFNFMNFSCEDSKKQIANNDKSIVTDTDTINLIDSTKKDNIPDYVPPKNAGYNNNWSANKNRKLNLKRECYFGRRYRFDKDTTSPSGNQPGQGYGYRYRYRGGRDDNFNDSMNQGGRRYRFRGGRNN